MKKRRFDFLFSIKYILLILTIICLVSLVFTYSRGDTIGVYKTAVSKLFSPISNAITGIGDYFSEKKQLSAEKEELQAKIEQLEEENRLLLEQLKKYQSDYYSLNEMKSLLEIKDEFASYPMVGAKVIAKENGNWFSKFTINRGSNDGIEKDMNVIAAGGLAGIVTQVGPDYAVVTSILDDQMNVSAIGRTSRASCMVMGDIDAMSEGYIRLMYMKKDADIREYDEIITSPTSSKYLPDLTIGYAVLLQTDPNNMTMSGYLIPAVDFENIENVMVIMKRK
ncbi:MAG: rod shape-determining protein MreC [Lachnospiraceae bacterium]|nr:rod shape-determining protein MreC [Lachnospiraceae bacterium]